MSNYITTTCTITGPADDIERFKRAHIVGETDEQRTLDFGTVVPVPQHEFSEPTREWYYENWGTGSNAWDFVVTLDEPGRLAFQFGTANAHPEPIFAKLAKMYPALLFSGEWIDDDDARRQFRNGKPRLTLVSARPTIL